MRFEEILPELRNGKSARRKSDISRIGYYFVRLEDDMFDWFHIQVNEKHHYHVQSGLNSDHVLSEDWEILE